MDTQLYSVIVVMLPIDGVFYVVATLYVLLCINGAFSRRGNFLFGSYPNMYYSVIMVFLSRCDIFYVVATLYVLLCNNGAFTHIGNFLCSSYPI